MPATATPPSPCARDGRRPVPPPKPVKAARRCGWDFKPFDLPTGGRMAFFYVTEGKKTDHYRAVWQDGDDMVSVIEVSKEQSDGSFAEPYFVTLPNPGVGGQCHCGCLGWQFTGKCRHAAALRTLLSRLLG
jgi:hypothetical protein